MLPEDTELWFAGKRMDCTQQLSKYVGANEKTTIIVSMQERGDPRPQREKVMYCNSHLVDRKVRRSLMGRAGFESTL